MANEQPRHGVPRRASAACRVVSPGAGHSAADGWNDRRSHPQQPLQLDQEPRRSPWRRGAATGRPASRSTAGARQGLVAQQRGNRRADSAGHGSRWPRAARDLAELPDGPRSLPELLRRARGTPPGPAVHGRASTRAAAPAECRRWDLAVDEAIPGMNPTPTRQ